MQRSGRNGRRHTWGRTKDADEHISRLRAEFAGLPEICHTHASLIVRIRRKIDLESTLTAFFELWSSKADELAAHLSSRWLVSACDTFADYGTPFQRAGALILSATINTLKLAETERLLLRDASPDPERIEAMKASHAAGVVHRASPGRATADAQPRDGVPRARRGGTIAQYRR